MAAADGKVVVVGGFGDMTATTIEPSCEIFEPMSGAWCLVLVALVLLVV